MRQQHGRGGSTEEVGDTDVGAARMRGTTEGGGTDGAAARMRWWHG